MDTPPITPSESPQPFAAGVSARHISDLPHDELLRYARELGLEARANIARPDLLEQVRQRQELLLKLDRDAMLDVVAWARRPVRRSASKEALAREIAKVLRTNFEDLSPRGLRVLGVLRGVPDAESADLEGLRHCLRQREGFWRRAARLRRAVVGAVLSQALDGPPADDGGAYQFLPEEEGGRTTLRSEIEDRGIVGGIASRLRGVADDYVREKLDEIEARIDRKLDDIDRRLAEWRDREIANRLRIIRITLIATVLFALVSLGYHALRR